jgi:hypothetical protein
VKLVYIAGPFTGKLDDTDRLRLATCAYEDARKTLEIKLKRFHTDRHILRAKMLGIEVAKLGACPWIPHANTDLLDFECVQPYEFWIEATLLQLRKCDALIMVDGWESSSGATGEHNEALMIGIPVFYTLTTLRRWLEADQ